jgi:hypothetical protein
MAESMTKTTGKSVKSFLAAVEDPTRRADAQTFLEMMERITGEKPKMWGDSIVGFGKYHYKYDSGHEGDTCLTGFSPRKNEFSLYLTGTYFEGMERQRDALLNKLGKHRMGKSCLYVKRTSDIDLKVLEELVTMSVEALRKHYPIQRTTGPG